MPTIKERVSNIHDKLVGYELNSREKVFLRNIVKYEKLSDKQEAALIRIEDKANRANAYTDTLIWVSYDY